MVSLLKLPKRRVSTLNYPREGIKSYTIPWEDFTCEEMIALDSMVGPEIFAFQLSEDCRIEVFFNAAK